MTQKDLKTNYNLTKSNLFTTQLKLNTRKRTNEKKKQKLKNIVNYKQKRNFEINLL